MPNTESNSSMSIRGLRIALQDVTNINICTVQRVKQLCQATISLRRPFAFLLKTLAIALILLAMVAGSRQ